ncbi:C-C chemokine receptor-like 2 isoform X2 [Tupaia chinensis]|uniref:C-C chemokine receptor-like 2 isoform X2 n=1 Tax=Tupaia chinensis TaxID=246437 RepID=UPI000FFCBC0C|nr:C-C chemokine receptor-like 2 isoform X2 [Tupaia chinensis]
MTYSNFRKGRPRMANFTTSPEDEYDVLIEGDLPGDEVEPCTEYDARGLSAQLVPPLCTTVFTVGLLDNILVALILVKRRQLRHVENVYFLNLAVSNMCFLLALPFWAHATSLGSGFGAPTCRILAGLYSAGLYSEAFFTALLAVQRYLVFFPVRCSSTATRPVRCSVITSTAAWASAMLAAVPESMFPDAQVESLKHTCFFGRPPLLPADQEFWKAFLTLKMNILVLAFPLFVLVFCYVRMRQTLRCRERQGDLFKLVFAVGVVFLLMWAPYNVALFLSTFREQLSLPRCDRSYSLHRSVQISEAIAATHCCVNPLLYMLLDEAFRKDLRHLFRPCGNTPLQPRGEPAQGTWREENEQATAV